jgi:hypothetical protein
LVDFTHKRTGRTVTVGEGLADRYRNSGRWTELTTAPLKVPSGTVSEVLAWVGDDPLRAVAARIVEERGKNRKSLLDAL